VTDLRVSLRLDADTGELVPVFTKAEQAVDRLTTATNRNNRATADAAATDARAAGDKQKLATATDQAAAADQREAGAAGMSTNAKAALKVATDLLTAAEQKELAATLTATAAQEASTTAEVAATGVAQRLAAVNAEVAIATTAQAAAVQACVPAQVQATAATAAQATVSAAITPRIVAQSAATSASMAATLLYASAKQKLVGVGTTLAGVLGYVTSAVRAGGNAALEAAAKWLGLGAAKEAVDKSSMSMLTRLGLIGAALAVVATAAVAVGGALVDAGNKQRSFETSMTAVVGTLGQARQEIGFVRAEADRIGISFQENVAHFAKMNAAAAETSLQGQGVRDIFTAVAEKSRVMGMTNEQVSGTFTALTQMLGKGKITAEELRGQLAERMPDAVRLMAKALGVGTAELDKMMTDGKLMAEDVLPKFAKELRNSAAAGIEAAKSSPAADFARLKNALFDASGGLANQTGFMEVLAAGARLLTSVLQGLPELIGTIKEAVALWAGVFDDAGNAMGEFGDDLTRSAGDWGDTIVGWVQFAIRALVELPANLKGLTIVAAGEFDKLYADAVAMWGGVQNSTETVWITIKGTVFGVIGDIRIAFAQMTDWLVSTSAGVTEKLANSASFVGADDTAEKMRANAAELRTLATYEQEVRASIDATNEAYVRRQAELANDSAALETTRVAARNAADEAIASGLAQIDADKAVAAAIRDKESAAWKYAAAGEAMAAGTKQQIENSKDAEKAQKSLETAERQALDMLDTLGGRMNETAAAQAEFDKGMRSLEQRMLAWAAAGGDAAMVAEKWQKGEDLLRANLTKTNAEIAKRNQLTSGNKDLANAITEQRNQLAGLTAAQVQYNAGVREANELAEKARAAGIDEQIVLDGLADRLEKLGELRDSSSLASIIEEWADSGAWDKLLEKIEETEEALKKATDPATVARLESSLGNLRHAMVSGIVDSSQQALRSMQTMVDDGSKAYLAMQVAIDALTVAQAISAVVNQAQGDPYTAFARMAAMAAAVAALGVSIGNFSSAGFTDTAAERQASQGTGTVLGDADAKSESIANATEITAKATSELVGINRGMLNALNSLTQALGAAAVQLARGAGDVEFGALPTPTQFSNASIGTRLGVPSLSQRLLGGSSRVTDQGLTISGGTIEQLLAGITVRAYQEVQSRSWAFGSTRTNTSGVDVSDELGTQFQLIVESIVDTVREGALALGMLPAEIEQALAAFRVEEIKISLKDLTPEEQQAELEAVFSALFDGLAGSVVPFIAQFQRVGEGIGETLVRVATEVQVMQQLFEQFGIAVDMTDPEKFAQLADGIVQAAGGLEEAQGLFERFNAAFYDKGEQMQTRVNTLVRARDERLGDLGLKPMTKEEFRAAFEAAMPSLTPEEIVEWMRVGEIVAAIEDVVSGLMDKFRDAFYSEEEQLEFNASTTRARATSQLEGLGLDADTTMQEFRRIFEARLPTLSEDAIVQWLRAAESLADATEAQREYNDAVSSATPAEMSRLQAIVEYDEVMQSVGRGSFAGAMARIRLEEEQLIATANRVARAAGLQGASERDLAAIHESAAQKIRQAMIELRNQTLELIETFNSGRTGLDIINDQIAALNQASQQAAGGVDELAQAQADLYQRQLEGYKSIKEWLDAQLVGDLSALSPEEQLAEARRQFEEMAALAAAGDADAIAALPRLADTFLRLSRDFNATGDSDFGRDAEWVRGIMSSILANQQTNPGGGTGGTGGPGVVQVGISPELQALFDQRDLYLMQSEAEHRAQLAEDLANHLRELAAAVDDPVLELMTTMGVDLRELATAMGVDLQNLTGASVVAMGELAHALGINLAELTDGLGLELTDLAGGLTELTTQLGIDFENLTGAQLESLANLAGQLGLSLTEITETMGFNLTDLSEGVLALTTQLGIDLGNLTVESTQALADLAGTLGADLAELSTAVGVDLGSLANSQSLLNNALEATINGLPSGTAQQLAPLLAAVEAATTEADANAAIAALEAATNALPPEFRNQLAPYLAGVFPAEAMNDLDYLHGIFDSANQIFTAIEDLEHQLWWKIDELVNVVRNNGTNTGSSAASMMYNPGDDGGNYGTSSATNPGEFFAPSNVVTDFLRSAGVSLGEQSTASALVQEMQQLRTELKLLREERKAGDRDIAEAVEKAGREGSGAVAGAIDRQTNQQQWTRTNQ
jgi:tape measure domain-containing protein